MAFVDLPASPGPASCRFIPVRFSELLTPPMGGEDQQINHLGNRWAIEVRLPRLSLAQAREWSAALTDGARNGARFKLRQLDLVIGAPGTVLVNGAGQGGLTLNVDGMTQWAGWTRGQFVNVITGGRRLLYMFSAAGHSADGTAALPFNTPLRRSPADNDVVDFMPQIEGTLSGADDWEIDDLRLGTAPPFMIREMV